MTTVVIDSTDTIVPICNIVPSLVIIVISITGSVILFVRNISNAIVTIDSMIQGEDISFILLSEWLIA